jgi:hypothetical protein
MTSSRPHALLSPLLAWSDGQGKREFRLHLKPTDGTSPDRCVRFYFEFDEERQITIVGWVGRHL